MYNVTCRNCNDVLHVSCITCRRANPAKQTTSVFVSTASLMCCYVVFSIQNSFFPSQRHLLIKGFNCKCGLLDFIKKVAFKSQQIHLVFHSSRNLPSKYPKISIAEYLCIKMIFSYCHDIACPPKALNKHSKK